MGHIKPWHSLRRTDRPCHRGKAGLLRRGQPLHPAPAASSRWDPHEAPLGPFRLRSLVGSSSPRCEDGSGPSPKPATTELGPKAHAGPSRVTKVALKIIRAAGVRSTPPPAPKHTRRPWTALAWPRCNAALEGTPGTADLMCHLDWAKAAHAASKHDFRVCACACFSSPASEPAGRAPRLVLPYPLRAQWRGRAQGRTRSLLVSRTAPSSSPGPPAPWFYATRPPLTVPSPQLAHGRSWDFLDSVIT